MTTLHPMDDDPCSTLESRIRDHCIQRARLDQPHPMYRVGDRDFDNIVRRLALPIAHGPATWSKRAPYVDYAFGTSTARIFAGGPLIPDLKIEVIEL